MMQAQTQQDVGSEQQVSQSLANSKPWWHDRSVGYVGAFPLVAAGVGLTYLGQIYLVQYFPSVFLLLAVLCTALWWGVGPGLLATFLSCAALIVFILVPFHYAGMITMDWDLLFQVLPFAVAGLVIAVIIGQREEARQRALRTTQIAEDQAERLTVANEELQRANQLKDFFLSIASHELKTPITTIRGHAQLALRHINKRGASSLNLEGLREAFTKVDEQTNRLANLVNDLLAFSSLRSGKLVLDTQLCDLNEICTKAVEEQRQLSKRAIELVLPGYPVQLRADANRLGQVLTNLVSNALKYSPATGQVSVRVGDGDGFVQLRVKDTGKGISPEQIENLFQPFYRTPEVRTSTISGTGLGLAICKEIIEQHSGRIWCESQLDCGSTFFVELPVSRT